ncbi:MAG: aldehyde dehydrogenase family protein [Clostridia bacterium]|nr:aldehyde dehydrogenase family protein [Clostridia bacterium]
MESKDYVKQYIDRSRKAQKQYESYTQEQVDEVVRIAAKTVHDNAELLAKMAVEETQMGVYEDKVIKNKMKAKVIWHNLKDKKSVGIIKRDEKTGITEIAKPMGTVAAITPTTNPIVTPMSNAMFALKGRNSIIITPHHRAMRCSSKTVELINQQLEKINAPKHLIQILDQQSRENTKHLIQNTDVVIATGGMGMVKAAYSSGKPALGVGAGNVQCIIDRGVDIKDAVSKIILGRTFDNGIICSGEQSVMIPQEIFKDVVAEFKANGAYYVSEYEEREKLRNTLFVYGEMNKHVVGQSVQRIAELAEINIHKDTKVIIVDVQDKTDILGKEKMCPVLALYQYDSFGDAVEIVSRNLEMEGKGHSVAIHSNNVENIEYAGENLKVSRIVINQPSATSAGGSFFNGFAPTNTLGCGSWGNNSISENLDYKHLINISRIGYYMKDNKVPADDELWNNRSVGSQCPT